MSSAVVLKRQVTIMRKSATVYAMIIISKGSSQEKTE